MLRWVHRRKQAKKKDKRKHRHPHALGSKGSKRVSFHGLPALGGDRGLSILPGSSAACSLPAGAGTAGAGASGTRSRSSSSGETVASRIIRFFRRKKAGSGSGKAGAGALPGLPAVRSHADRARVLKREYTLHGIRRQCGIPPDVLAFASGSGDPVAPYLRQCVNFLKDTPDLLCTEGLFRVTGNVQEVNEWVEIFERGQGDTLLNAPKLNV